MNVGSYMTRAAQHYPQNIAAVFEEKKFTYPELNKRTDSLANAFKTLGIGKGDRVGILQKNSHCFLETLFACFKIGACAIPMNFRLHPNEVAYHLNDARALAIVFSGDFNEAIKGIEEKASHTKHHISLQNPLDGQLDYEQMVSDNETSEDQTIEVADDDLGWLFYTSGTTGKPKGAMLTHANLVATSVGWCADLMHLEPEDVAMQAAPLSHGGGIHAIAVVAKAGNNVILDGWKPKEVMACIEKYQVTNTWAVPTMIKMLITDPDLEKYDLSSLKWVVYGGSPMYVEDLKTAIRKIGPVFVQIFGQGESPMTGTFMRKEDHIIDGGPEAEQRLLSAGIARTDMEVKILDENDQELPYGEKGEIALKGPAVMKGYWERPEENAETLRNGWLHTGDVGYMDQKGYMYIVDRFKDCIISGGANIYPRELEEIIIQHPAVQEVAVIGVPDEFWGEAVKACIILKPGQATTGEEIISYCSQHMGSYKKPKSVEFLEELPKSNYGKVLKRTLRDQYTE
ncbi:MAG: long-chain fatty acid--CoA ligase [Desulfobacteraceae bacterium]|nr:long-chain fatty acid--CoA ligase [Desulfobacteraceae bacterium]